MAGLFVAIWYHPLSGGVYEYGQYSITTSEKIREVLSDVHLSLDNCYSTSKNGNAVDLDDTWISVFGSGDEANIYQVNCTVPLTSHGHIDTLHMRHIQETVKDYSAMRGPCPEGFHIPLQSERVTTRRILVGLGISLSLHGPQMSYLKIPATGSYQYGGSLTRRNSVGQARCCNTYNGNGRSIYGFRDADGSNSSKSNVMVIRPRKDVPVVPDNTWTTIFDGSSVASGAGIFWKEDQHMISLSSDGTNWITMSDRNVGATKAGTEKNSACVGKVFQRGNNYGFTYNGDSSAPTFPNRTSTKIDVSGYGPSEYSSSTYYDGGRNQDWASVANNDLRGGVTGKKTVTVDRREPVYYGPTHTLQSWEELIAYTDIDALITELNKAPEEYYNKLTDEHKLYTCASVVYYFCYGDWVFVGGYLPGYDTNTKTWAKGPTRSPCPS